MDDAAELEEYPWPAKGDDPFKLGDSPLALIACVNFTHDEPWYGYAEGFKRMADLGVFYLEQRGHEQDYFVYPIVFCYRQYIELLLKQIIRTGRTLLDEPGGTPRLTHDLNTLWGIAKPLLERIAGDPETYRNVGACLARFNALDPKSAAFRFPVTRSGTPSLPGVSSVDLGQVRGVVTRLGTYLECVVQDLDVRLDFKYELAHEYSA